MSVSPGPSSTPDPVTDRLPGTLALSDGERVEPVRQVPAHQAVSAAAEHVQPRAARLLFSQ